MDIKKTFEEAKYKAKRGAEVVCDTASNLGRSFVEFAKENPSAAIGIAVPIGVAAIRSGQSLIVTHRLKVQNKMASRKIYDASLGTSWDLRRPLTNNDRKAISQMRANGSSLSDALASRKLI